jgi:hypothetical protein
MLPLRCADEANLPPSAGIYSRYSSQFTTSILSGATWDRELWDYRADIMSKEYKAAGINVPLSIVAGPVSRSPYGGRKFVLVFFLPPLPPKADLLFLEAGKASVPTRTSLVLPFVLPSRLSRKTTLTVTSRFVFLLLSHVPAFADFSPLVDSTSTATSKSVTVSALLRASEVTFSTPLFTPTSMLRPLARCIRSPLPKPSGAFLASPVLPAVSPSASSFFSCAYRCPLLPFLLRCAQSALTPTLSHRRSGAASIMCSYNKVNESLACENDEVLNKLLKEEVRLCSSLSSSCFPL